MTVEMPSFDRDYYEILQVHPKATLAVIKKAYRTLMLEDGAHPDRGGSAEGAARITEAYKVLSNAEARAEYDRWYMAKMGFSPRAAEPKADKAKDKPQDKAKPKEPAAAADGGSMIVACPSCATKNRVRSAELLAVAKCSKCGAALNKMPNVVFDLKEHVLSAVSDRLGRVGLPRWVKIGVPVLMLAASLAALGYVLADTWPIGDPIEKADQLRHEHKLDQAAHLLEKAVDKEPENPRLHEKLGDVYTKQGMLEDALKEYETAIRYNPSNSYLYTLQGNTFFSMEKFAAAEQAYRNALRVDPQQDQALANLGNVYARLRHFDKAEASYKQALRGRQNPDVLYNLGMVYQWDNKPTQATQAFRDALIADPNHRSSMVSLASLYYERHQYAMAAAQLVKASHLKHTDLDLHLRLADIYERTNRREEAIYEWQVCLEQAKERPAIADRARRALQRLAG